MSVSVAIWTVKKWRLELQDRVFRDFWKDSYWFYVIKYGALEKIVFWSFCIIGIAWLIGFLFEENVEYSIRLIFLLMWIVWIIWLLYSLTNYIKFNDSFIEKRSLFCKRKINYYEIINLKFIESSMLFEINTRNKVINFNWNTKWVIQLLDALFQSWFDSERKFKNELNNRINTFTDKKSKLISVLKKNKNLARIVN